MTLPQATAVLESPTVPSAETQPRLHGRRLIVARVLWCAVALVVVGAFVASVVASIASIASIEAVCPTAACENLHATQGTTTALRELHLSFVVISGYGLALNILFMTVYSLIAGVLFWRRADDRLALLSSIALLVFGAGTF